MLGWTVTGGASSSLSLRELDDPVPRADETLVQVEAFAPNPGDLAALTAAAPGTVPGWDGSGIVLTQAAEGHGPRAGEHVIFLGLTGGWAQRRAVSNTMIAPAPTDTSWEHLAALPVAATSALRAIRRLGSLLGRPVLIVGAGSAVGSFAVQLAARAGAVVVAVARNENQHDLIRELGAHHVHTTVSAVRTPVYGAIDLIGGQHLVDTYARLQPGGTVIALGHAAGAGETFPYGAFVADPATANRSITSFFLGTEPHLATEMAYLAADPTLHAGLLDARPWTELGTWASGELPKRLGRAVFRVHQ